MKFTLENAIKEILAWDDFIDEHDINMGWDATLHAIAEMFYVRFGKWNEISNPPENGEVCLFLNVFSSATKYPFVGVMKDSKTINIETSKEETVTHWISLPDNPKGEINVGI